LAVAGGAPEVEVLAELEVAGGFDGGLVAGVPAQVREGVPAVAGRESVGEGGDLALGFPGVPVLEGSGAVDVVRVAGVLRYPGDSDPCGVAHVASEGWVDDLALVEWEVWRLRVAVGVLPELGVGHRPRSVYWSRAPPLAAARCGRRLPSRGNTPV